MFIVWELEGSPHYVSMEPDQRIAYISDIGAQGLQPLFIAGSTVTTVFLDLSFASERWLRHTGRLAKNLGVTEKVLSALSIVFALAGTCGLILLSIFDVVSHDRLHDGFLLLFMGEWLIKSLLPLGYHRETRRRTSSTPVASPANRPPPPSPLSPHVERQGNLY